MNLVEVYVTNIRASIYGKGYSQEEVTAQVICFEAMRRMEEEHGTIN